MKLRADKIMLRAIGSKLPCGKSFLRPSVSFIPSTLFEHGLPEHPHFLLHLTTDTRRKRFKNYIVGNI